jgi:tetratricopeptide (TPR) repeat protein
MHRSPPAIFRYLIISFILIFSSAAFYLLSQKLIGQLHIRRAEQETLSLRYGSAVEQFQKAAVYLPDDFLINNGLGNIYYRMGSLAPETPERLILFNRAKEYFFKALELNPLDARSAYGLARAEIRLEQLNVLSGKKNIEGVKATAISALEKAIELRPASTIYHLALARYLHLHNENERLLFEIRMLGRLQPQPANLNRLRREPFWSVAARKAFQLGVQEALAAGTTPRQSLFALSDIMAEERNYKEAISYRIKGMDVQEALNGSGDYIRLGSLYLTADKRVQAFEKFFLSLQYSEDIEKDIIGIMRTCSRAYDPQALVDFYQEVGEKYSTSSMVDISAARFMIELQDFENARTILHNSNARQPDGEAYYLLMRIAEEKEDWDEAELSIQKAAMHDPQNSRYHLAFSRVLNRLQKYERAEKEAGLTIQYIDNASAGLFHYRAGLRMRLQDFAGALEDWLQAIKIDQQKASYYYRAGDALEKMSRIDEAAENFQKAIELEPGNKTYIQRLERIVKKYGVKE